MIMSDLKHKSEIEKLSSDNLNKFDFYQKEQTLKAKAMQVLLVLVYIRNIYIYMYELIIINGIFIINGIYCFT